jgi:hypothetical protein
MTCDSLSVLPRLFRRRDNRSAGQLLAPLLRNTVRELRRHHVPPQRAVALIEGGDGTDFSAGRVSRRTGWWLSLDGTAHRGGAALWIDRDARHWDDDSDPLVWHLESTRHPSRLPAWVLRSYGPRLRDGGSSTLEVVVDHRVEGGLAVVGSAGRDHNSHRWPFVDVIARAVAQAAERAGELS